MNLKSLFVAILMALVSVVIASAQQPGVYTVTSSSRLNVRATPSKSGALITKLQPGSEVSVLSVDGAWACVELANGRRGYVSSKYIEYRHSFNYEITTTATTKYVRSTDWVKEMFDNKGSSPTTALVLAVILALITIGSFFLDLDDNSGGALAIMAILLIGSCGCVLGILDYGPGKDIVSNNVLYVIALVVMAAVCLSQARLYMSLFDGLSDGMYGADSDDIEKGVTIPVVGGGLMGIVRALCGLFDWEVPEWSFVVLLCFVGLGCIFIMKAAFSGDGVLSGLLMCVLAFGGAWMASIEVTIIIYSTYGLLVILFLAAALLSDGGGVGVPSMSSSSSGGGSGSGSSSRNPEFFHYDNIHQHKAGKYINSNTFRELNGTEWHRSGGSWHRW